MVEADVEPVVRRDIGPVAADQIESYARRKRMKLSDVERWLAPNLAYDP